MREGLGKGEICKESGGMMGATTDKWGKLNRAREGGGKKRGKSRKRIIEALKKLNICIWINLYHI